MPSMIYSILKKDHDELKPMLKELAAGKEGRLQEMVDELKAHSEVEEKTFYKPLEGKQKTKELIAEGYKEHKEADKLSKQLMKAKGDREKFVATAKKLQEAVEHHIEEEEGEMFEKAREVLSADQARSIAKEFQEEKERFLSKTMARA